MTLMLCVNFTMFTNDRVALVVRDHLLNHILTDNLIAPRLVDHLIILVLRDNFMTFMFSFHNPLLRDYLITPIIRDEP